MQKSPRGTPLASILTHDGAEVAASFCVEPSQSGFIVHLASRSGAGGSRGERNPEYSRGLEILLSRMVAARAVLHDALLDSRRYLAVPEAERRLRLPDAFATPLQLRPGVDPAALRSALTSSQGGLLTAARGSHGNTTRAIALHVTDVPWNLNDPVKFGKYLATGVAPVAYPTPVQIDEPPQSGGYVPGGADDRDRSFRSIIQRRGQPKFRKALLARFQGRCVVTGCQLVDVLEAAHVDPYRGAATNAPDNGLLLRADIHTLFDLDLIGIEPGTLVVHVKPSAAAAGYGSLAGRRLALAASQAPSEAALRKRWADFQGRP